MLICIYVEYISRNAPMNDANLPKCNNALCISAFEHQRIRNECFFLYYSERLYSGAQCQRPSIVTHTENKFIWHF